MKKVCNVIGMFLVMVGVLGAPLLHEIEHALHIQLDFERTLASGHTHSDDEHSNGFTVGVDLSHPGDLNCVHCNPVSSTDLENGRRLFLDSDSKLASTPAGNLLGTQYFAYLNIRGPPVST